MNSIRRSSSLCGVIASLVAAIALVTSTASWAGPVANETGPNLVTNGSFEATLGVAGSGWTASGFTAEGFDYFIDTVPSDAQSGNHSFAGGGVGAPGFISQNLATVVGADYNIHFWLANLSGFSGGTELQVLWNGALVYDAKGILGFGYREIIIDPMATSTSTALSFGLQDDSFFLNLDSISVRQVASAVPEPATLALLSLGLAGLGLSRRKQ